MSTVCEALLSISGYPIPIRTIETICTKRSIAPTDEVTSATFATKGYRLAVADLLMWLFNAPNVAQGGQSYSLTDAQRENFRKRAAKIYSDLGDADGNSIDIRYGYKGTRL